MLTSCVFTINEERKSDVESTPTIQFVREPDLAAVKTALTSTQLFGVPLRETEQRFDHFKPTFQSEVTENLTEFFERATGPIDFEMNYIYRLLSRKIKKRLLTTVDIDGVVSDLNKVRKENGEKRIDHKRFVQFIKLTRLDRPMHIPEKDLELEKLSKGRGVALRKAEAKKKRDQLERSTQLEIGRAHV